MEKVRINEFFEDILRAKLKNSRWSWGATDPKRNRVFLRVWSDDIKKDDAGDRVWVYRRRPAGGQSHGAVERGKHIEAIKNGAQGFGVVCRARDTREKPRRIADYEKDALLQLGAFSEDTAGRIYARVEWMPISELKSPTQSKRARK